MSEGRKEADELSASPLFSNQRRLEEASPRPRRKRGEKRKTQERAGWKRERESERASERASESESESERESERERARERERGCSQKKVEAGISRSRQTNSSASIRAQQGFGVFLLPQASLASFTCALNPL